MNFKLGTRGVGIVAVLLIVAALSIMSAVIASFVATGGISKTNELVSEQAFELTHAGFEYALKRVSEGTNPNGEVKSLGNGQFTVNYQNGGLLTINTNVSAIEGAANPSFSIQGPPVRMMGDCLTVNVSAASLSFGTSLTGITLQNACNSVITISGMTVAWNPATTEKMTQINIGGGSAEFDNASGISSGVPATPFTSYSVPACPLSPISLTNINFNSNMSGKNFTLNFTMSDGSVKTAFVQAITSNEAACLNVNLSATVVGGTNSVRLNGGTLTNTCSAPTSIRLDSMTITAAPASPARTLNNISLGGVVVWTGTNANGVEAVLATPQTIAASGTLAQTYLEFSADMRGFNYQITYKMEDATTLTVPLNLYETNMGACLTVNTSGCNLSSNKKDVQGQLWVNSCALGIVVDKVQTTWTGSSRTLQQIVVNGTTVFNGPAVSSGTSVDITNDGIPGSFTHTVDRYRFSGAMNGRCFTHVITVWTGQTISVPSYCL